MPINNPKFVRMSEPPPSPPAPSTEKKSCCGGGMEQGGGHCGCHCWGGRLVKKLFLVLLGILLVYGIFYVGTLIRNNIKKYDYIGKADRMERTITVNGSGKVSGNNDIAVTTIGYSNTDKDVAKAQLANKKVMDQIMKALKGLGVAEKDMQTNYSIYPEYNYTQDRGQQLIGYRVSNQITVKIRDLTKIPEILGLAGQYGATEVAGLSFTIDEPENLKTQAREKALVDAKMKAIVLAKALNVRLGSVVSFNEYETGGDYYPMAVKSYGMGGLGVGGGAPEAVASGSKDVTMNVSVTYEIWPR